MRQTTELYRRLISDPSHYFEVSIVIGKKGILITEQREKILFGGTAILVDRGGADGGYNKTKIISMSAKTSVFKDNCPSVGNAISGELDLKMIAPTGDIPRMAQIYPYVRVCAGSERSEWLHMGVYYIDTRSTTHDDGIEVLTIHAYDPMLLAEQDFSTEAAESFPCSDIVALTYIAGLIECEIDARTIAVINKNYSIQLPAGYSCRDTLCYIAALYGGSFIINDEGQLQLILYGDLNKETRYLINDDGFCITFGGVRVLV